MSARGSFSYLESQRLAEWLNVLKYTSNGLDFSTNTCLTYGLELEFYAPKDQTRAILTEIRNEDITVECTDWQGRQSAEDYDRFEWQYSTDGSLRYAPSSDYRGVEMKTKPMSLQRMFGTLRNVTRILRDFNCEVNKSCGIHLHVHSRHFKGKHLKNLVNLYARYERTIDCLVPQSRRANNCTWARSIESNVDRILQVQRGTRGQENILLHRSNNGNNIKYSKLNLLPFENIGTVEFRHFGGSLDCDKIIGWVSFLACLHKRALGKKVDKPARFMRQPMSNLIKTLGLVKDDGGGFLRAINEEALLVCEWLEKRMQDNGFSQVACDVLKPLSDASDNEIDKREIAKNVMLDLRTQLLENQFFNDALAQRCIREALAEFLTVDRIENSCNRLYMNNQL